LAPPGVAASLPHDQYTGGGSVNATLSLQPEEHTKVQSLGSFLIAAFALAGSPGPNTLSVAGVAAAFGHVAALRYTLGIVLGMVLVISMVGTGVTGFLLAIPGAAPVIMTAAACYFIYLAWRIATSPPLQSDSALDTAPKWYEGLILSLINPKAYAAMAAMFSTFVLIPHNTVTDGLVKASLLLVIAIIVNICWLLAGIAMTRLLRNARTARLLNAGFAIALILSVLMTVLI